jgi:hypothetical protein
MLAAAPSVQKDTAIKAFESIRPGMNAGAVTVGRMRVDPLHMRMSDSDLHGSAGLNRALAAVKAGGSLRTCTQRTLNLLLLRGTR